jgi:putative ABC transport system permease protein
VMGASVSQVMVLMSKDFAILIAVAFVVATPLAWYFSQSWLEGFANRVNIDVSVVIISGALSIIIALLTISYQSLKAARENPVNAMRSE